MILDEENYLEHYGILRKSGRYPWGSGETQNQRNRDFLAYFDDLKAKGLSEVEICKGIGIKTTQYRAARSIAKAAEKQAEISQAQTLHDKGYSNVAIGERMGKNESSVRALLAPGAADKIDILQSTANMLKEQVELKTYIDVGSGVENHLGIARNRLDIALHMLKEEGYEVHKVQEDQLGTAPGNKTTIKVLAPPGTLYKDINANRHMIQQITDINSDNHGRTFYGIKTPLNINSKRIGINYAEDGGSRLDGVIYVRRGVKDVSLGNNHYAQVRVAVDGTHFLKGMAIYKDDMPPGVDLVFNTSKSNTGNKLDAMKSMKTDRENEIDPDNPFGSIVKQIGDHDANGRITNVTSAMNLVYEEGNWEKWNNSLSSQFLSKQSPKLAKEQLDMTFERKQREFDEIMTITNPTVKKRLLEAFADGADASAVHLRAAALPRQRTQVILPLTSLKDNEIYAPNFKNGERVVLIRHPHGGVFELPELTVNNRHPEGRRIIGPKSKDAVGINSKVAQHLSGADFDGDTVLVVPNTSRRVKTAPMLESLKGFDPKRKYSAYDGMKTMDGGRWNATTNKVEFEPGKHSSSRTKGIEMGDVSNLITDMTIKGASSDELARAIRHSMVVIDAEKHSLNWRLSAEENGIKQLKTKYQGGPQHGANTLISQAKGRIDVPKKSPRPAKRGGPVDPETGKLVFEPTGETMVRRRVSKRTGQITEKVVPVMQTSKKLIETDDAFTLSSGTKMESIYATHSNKLKAMANDARKEAYGLRGIPYSPSAKQVFSKEVSSLDAKLNIARRNRPLERQAQVIANATLRERKAANPDMSRDEEKKIKAQVLHEARGRTKADKSRIDITDDEWLAIQAGAITNHKLTEILKKADVERVRELATPRIEPKMTSAKTTRAMSMVNAGYTQAEIAEALGVSLTTLKTSIYEREG